MAPKAGCHFALNNAQWRPNGSFKVSQGHRFWYRLKARIRLPISERYNLISYLVPFPSYCGVLVKFVFCLYLTRSCGAQQISIGYSTVWAWIDSVTTTGGRGGIATPLAIACIWRSARESLINTNTNICT